MTGIRKAHLAIGAGALVVAAALSGCTPQATPSATATGSHGSPTSSTAPENVAPSDNVDDGTVAPAPTANAAAQSDALQAAVKVMTTFAQPQLSASAWMQQMTPLLSQSGATAYEGTDPSQIPVHQVTGGPTLVDGATDVALIVRVPTDAGDYLVSLSRTSSSGKWLADRIRPAQG